MKKIYEPKPDLDDHRILLENVWVNDHTFIVGRNKNSVGLVHRPRLHSGKFTMRCLGFQPTEGNSFNGFDADDLTDFLREWINVGWIFYVCDDMGELGSLLSDIYEEIS